MFIDIKNVSMELVGKGEKKIPQKGAGKLVCVLSCLLSVSVVFYVHLDPTLAGTLEKSPF